MFTLNRFSEIPVYEQIVTAVERDIMLGTINENDKLPSVRELAITLGVNPNTVQKAYAELHSKGIIITVASSGAFVANDAARIIKSKKEALLKKIRELSTELYFAGFEENEVINEVKLAFSTPTPISEKATKTEGKSIQKKVKVSPPKTALTKNEPAKKEPEAPASVPTIRKKKMGIELL